MSGMGWWREPIEILVESANALKRSRLETIKIENFLAIVNFLEVRNFLETPNFLEKLLRLDASSGKLKLRTILENSKIQNPAFGHQWNVSQVP